jgi:THAP domain
VKLFSNLEIMSDNAEISSTIIGRLRYSCKYPACKNRYYSPISVSNNCKNKKFHHCPSDTTLSLKWKSICRVLPLEHDMRFYVCEDHFTIFDYSCSDKNYLLTGACPHSEIADAVSFLPCEEMANPQIKNELNNTSLSLPLNFRFVVMRFHRDQIGTVLGEHSYHVPIHQIISKRPKQSIIFHLDKFSFLTDRKTGFLKRVGLSISQLSHEEAKPYQSTKMLHLI